MHMLRFGSLNACPFHALFFFFFNTLCVRSHTNTTSIHKMNWNRTNAQNRENNNIHRTYQHSCCDDILDFPLVHTFIYHFIGRLSIYIFLFFSHFINGQINIDRFISKDEYISFGCVCNAIIIEETHSMCLSH